ncbi:MAG: efflux RND transporter periplasmic adaptor subunit [Alphaproteobacteria bacterium]|nr:efflux RND transporter periplasmic adaptor subunit [Alphaproteobacteria bacterium]
MDIRLPYSERPPEPLEDRRLSRRSAHVRWRIAAGIAGVLLVALVLWRLFAPAGEDRQREPSPPPVRVGVAQLQDVTVQEHTIGTIVANATVQVTSRVEGQMVAAHFKEGEFVRKGDLLFQLDPRLFQAALAQAEAMQARDQASLASARNDAARYAALASQGAASRSQTDQFTAQAKALAATVAADRANVETARLNVMYAQIRSPINGKTGPILIQPGNVVPANGTNPLVVITQIQPVKVSFFLPQADLPRIQEQMQKHQLVASLQVHDAHTGLSAPVDFIGNAVDNTTGTVELRATFNNEDLRLVPGQLLDVSVSLAHLPKVIVVPREAVNLGPQNRYVFVVTPQRIARMVPVTVLNDDGKLAAISGNVRPGDRVITDGQLRVVPGKAVAAQAEHGTGTRRSARAP